MPRNHFKAFQKVATDANKIIVVRLTKPASINLINRGAPAKGLDLSKAKIECSARTGVATASGQSQIDEARNLGYYVVDVDGVARNKRGQSIPFKAGVKWDVQPGQVIDPKLNKPITADYDISDVVDSKAQPIVVGVDSTAVTTPSNARFDH